MTDLMEISEIRRRVVQQDQERGLLSDTVNLADAPDMEQLEEWASSDGGCEATDGCWVEVDGVCPHGRKSWMLVLGLV
jgi:hypothetical protein